jgi:hypothetical protein
MESCSRCNSLLYLEIKNQSHVLEINDLYWAWCVYSHQCNFHFFTSCIAIEIFIEKGENLRCLFRRREVSLYIFNE